MNNQVYTYRNIAVSSQILSGQGVIKGIFVASASSVPTIKVWDALTATGTVVLNTFTPVGATYYDLSGVALKTGCYVTISGTVNCTVFTDR